MVRRVGHQPYFTGKKCVCMLGKSSKRLAQLGRGPDRT